MADKYQALREALARENGRWIAVAYGPKTMGVGISGGPALFLARPGSGTEIEDVSQIVSDLCSIRNDADALLAERDALRKALQSARQTLTVAIRAAWEDDSEDVSDHLTIKEIDAALAQ